jgi:hypothetical protein
MDGSAVMMKRTLLGGNGKQEQGLYPSRQRIRRNIRLVKVVAVHKYETDGMGKWTGKIWE